MQSYRNFLIVPIVFLIVSCTQTTSRMPVDVSQVALDDIHIERFDRAFGSLTTDSLTDPATVLHQQWKTTYGRFYKDFIERMLRIGSIDDDRATPLLLAGIAGKPDFDSLKRSVEEVFPDLADQEAQLTDAFRHIRYYLPEAPVPSRFVAFFSGFAVQIPVGEDYIGIGLDLFLGADSKFYPGLTGTFPRYISRRFTPDHLVPRVMESYIYEEILGEPGQNATFLDQMLYHGKAMYLMDMALPLVADSLKIGYTDKQLAWATHFQDQVWEWMVSGELLYQTDHSKINRYFSEAPFTTGLGEKNESAPKLGIFMGWQLVRRYMERFPETSIPQLMEMTDGYQIL